MFQPLRALLVPLLKDILRYGIGESERDEVSGIGLFPMRQMTMLLRNFTLLIECLEAPVWKTVSRDRLEA